MWNVYVGVNLDGIFNFYLEVVEYFDEEGFLCK